MLQPGPHLQGQASVPLFLKAPLELHMLPRHLSETAWAQGLCPPTLTEPVPVLMEEHLIPDVNAGGSSSCENKDPCSPTCSAPAKKLSGRFPN